MKKATSSTKIFRLCGGMAVALGSMILASDPSDARTAKDLVKGATIGAGIGVLVDGSSGVLSGATAGALVAAISRRSR